MTPQHPDLATRNFPTAEEEAAALRPTPRYEGPDSSYRLAFTDNQFLLREELRPVRMQLELLKPEMVLSEERIGRHRGAVRQRPPDTTRRSRAAPGIGRTRQRRRGTGARAAWIC